MLILLDLTQNLITRLSAIFFTDSCNIELLFLKSSKITDKPDCNIFNTLKLKILQTDKYMLCCLLPPKVECTAVKPWYVSFTDMISSTPMKISFYIMAFAIFCANIVSLVIQKNSWIKSGVFTKRAFGSIVVSINILNLSYVMHIIILCTYNGIPSIP